MPSLLRFLTEYPPESRDTHAVAVMPRSSRMSAVSFLVRPRGCSPVGHHSGHPVLSHRGGVTGLCDPRRPQLSPDRGTKKHMAEELDDAATPQGGRRRVRTHRLEGLSDGVFAIAITLLVLDLAVPGSREELFHAFFRGVARLPRVRGELLFHRGHLARPQRHHGVPRASGFDPAASQPAPPPVRVVPTLSYEVGRPVPRSQTQRTGGYHDLRDHPPGGRIPAVGDVEIRRPGRTRPAPTWTTSKSPS